jgi:hypothetical protein
MTIDIISTIGNVIFFKPETLVRLGSPQDICGTHPFVVLDVACRDGFNVCLVVPLTTKGSRHSAVRIPDEFLCGTDAFRSRASYVYSVWYAHWIPAWALLEATAPSPAARHNGNHLTAAGVRFVLDRIVVPPRDHAAT